MPTWLPNMLVYEMPRMVRIRHRKLAILNRLLQLLLIFYYIVFVLSWSRGHQRFDSAVSGSQAQVHGISHLDHLQSGASERIIFDSADHTAQSNQADSLLVITRTSRRTEQSYGKCAEARDLEDAYCESDDHCRQGMSAGRSINSLAGELPENWFMDLDSAPHGVFTGKCILDQYVCQIFGWCPVQEDIENLHNGAFKSSQGRRNFFNLESNMNNSDQESDLDYSEIKDSIFPTLDEIKPINDVLNLTLFIRTFIFFPIFNVTLSNILPEMEQKFLATCLYSPDDESNKHCPNFRIGDILQLANVSSHRALHFGAEIAITLDWNCNLDWPLDYCRPSYNFVHLDGGPDKVTGFQGLDEGIAVDLVTYNRRHGRTIKSINGLYFVIRTTGVAGKFNLFTFTMNFGANLALMCFASYLCDIWLYSCTKRKKEYYSASHQNLDALLAKIYKEHVSNSVRLTDIKPRETISVENSKPTSSKQPICSNMLPHSISLDLYHTQER